jgi:hypothetical protein
MKISAIEGAETKEEWNEEISSLFSFLCWITFIELGVSERNDESQRYLEALIRRGFNAPKNRPRKSLRVERDARWLKAYLENQLKKDPQDIHFQDAVDAIRALEKIPLDKDIRERVRRAEAALGWKLKRGKRKD